MSKIAFHRALADFVARSAVRLSRWGGADHGRQDKSAASGQRLGLVGLEIFGIQATRPAGAFRQIANDFKSRSAISVIGRVRSPP